MSSNTVGALKQFLAEFGDDCVVYGYEEIDGINIDGEGPSAIVVVKPDGNLSHFATGDYAWTSSHEPSLAQSHKELTT